MIGRLQRVPLREVWRHEAYDFTQWLQENLEALSEELDLQLVNAEREQRAGTFSVDLVAEDEAGGKVIIENQLAKSDHDHLGKVLTYLVLMEARAAVWVVSSPRPEHVAAITWLNESSSANFYMVKLEAVQIGDSQPAPLFTLIVGPSEEAKEVGFAKKEFAERYAIRKRWWSQLIDRSTTKNKLHAHITPGEYSWIGTSSGVRGLGLNYVVTQTECGAELYIDRGKGCDDENAAIFDALEINKSAIEGSFKGALSWQRLESRRACRIKYTNKSGGYRSAESAWPDLHDDVIDAMARLETALRPFLAKLKA